MKITFPNESYPIEFPNFDWADFKVGSVFDDTVFGWWGNTYIKISKKDYLKHICDEA